jgi:hypothetical protein
MGRNKGYRTSKRIEIEPLVIKEFNRTKLKKGEKVIDNRDSTIAKIFGVKTSLVSEILIEYLDLKFERIRNEHAITRNS